MDTNTIIILVLLGAATLGGLILLTGKKPKIELREIHPPEKGEPTLREAASITYEAQKIVDGHVQRKAFEKKVEVEADIELEDKLLRMERVAKKASESFGRSAGSGG